jgi:parallel beta-helix repeat protein
MNAHRNYNMKERMLSKGLAVAVIILFTGMSINPSTGTIIVKKSSTTIGSSGYIQDLIDSASNGDTIYIPRGTYFENILIDKSISLIGESNQTTIINGGGKDDVILVTANNVNISGFTIKNSGNKGWQNDHDAGIDINSINSIISNNIILNNHHGIVSKDGSFNLFSNNLISDNNAHGIALWDNGNNTISYNTISKNSDGLLVKYEKYNKILNNNFDSNKNFGLSVNTNHNTISDNIFYNDGLNYEASSNVIINNTVNDKPLIYLEKQTNKTITEQAGQIILVKCDNITIKNQEINNIYIAIQLFKTNNCMISDCILSDNSNIGIDLERSNNNVISNNIIDSNGWIGIAVYFSNYNTFKDNTFSKNKLYGIWLIGSSDHISIKNNVFEKNRNSGIALSENNNGEEDITPNNINISCNLFRLNFEGGVSSSLTSRDVIIVNNTFTNNKIGIKLFRSKNLTITNNNVNKNLFGIVVSESPPGIIKRNSISKNFVGLKIGSAHILISQNNFLRNLIQATFILESSEYDSVEWVGNYWNRPRFLPKPIIGRTFLPPPSIEFKVMYDLNPALKPYDIEV